MSIVYRGSLSLWHTYFSRKFPVSKHFSGSILKDHPQNFNPLGCSFGWWSCPWLVKCWFFDPDSGCSSFLNGTCLPRLIWNHVSPTQTTLQPQKQQQYPPPKKNENYQLHTKLSCQNHLVIVFFFAFQEFFTCQGPTSQAWKCPRQSLVPWDESELGFLVGRNPVRAPWLSWRCVAYQSIICIYKNVIYIYIYLFLYEYIYLYLYKYIYLYLYTNINIYCVYTIQIDIYV